MLCRRGSFVIRIQRKLPLVFDSKATALVVHISALALGRFGALCELLEVWGFIGKAECFYHHLEGF